MCPSPPKAPFGTRTPLKKTAKSRPMNAQQYLAALGKAKSIQGGRCIGLIAGVEHECADPFDAMHKIPQRTITDHTDDPKALADHRNIYYGCRTIHAMFDAGRIELPDPDGFDDYCTDFGFDSNDGRYWFGVPVEGAGA